MTPATPLCLPWSAGVSCCRPRKLQNPTVPTLLAPIFFADTAAPFRGGFGAFVRRLEKFSLYAAMTRCPSQHEEACD
jgi:hypothetical protein